VPRLVSVACLGTLCAWARAAAAEPEPCPHGNEAWVRVVFAGPVWTDATREAILRELRVELARRALQACAESSQAASAPPNPANPPKKLVTLLANDAERVSILPADLQSEGGFVGRTVLVGAIPEDARPLAIAQAVDEALRSDSSRPSEPAVVPPKPPVIQRPPEEPPASDLVLGAALAPALQIAPPIFQGATRSTIAPGMVMRLSLRSSNLGGSLGIAITRTSELTFGPVAVRQLRLPLDLSLRGRLHRGLLECLFDVGAVAALVDYEHGPTDLSYRRLELGGRVGVSIGWGRRFVPWLGASVELLPSSLELKLAPTGTFGHTPQLWLGVALGTEVRWP
jgi:hypothetical protein